MELYEEILSKYDDALRNKPAQEAEALVHDAAYQSIKKIKMILEQDHLDDKECFWRIEEIVRAFEEIGSDGGNRHDFG